ncbi:unnamed protein product [Medioppia subpectinata]|uniref:Uncharacterized protein n=1 Tax=Medioppia subpectinata TaxID=1979941 RepID=A0A7R9PU11_9ACAR|nr:unnamed protein product [Medioppia subpectinata]CAG2101023.1 unnamed protein product [Medioppia subpectinata]
MQTNFDLRSNVDYESEDNYDLMKDCIYPTLSDGLNKFLAPILVSNVILKDNKEKEIDLVKTLIASLSYLLHPLSSLLGVWHPFDVIKTNKSSDVLIISSVLPLNQCFSYGTQITNPMQIELPRSMVDVVVAWNIPMHIWLKTRTMYSTLQRKGFNFQIWSVLLSLGILTKLEYDLREELSKIFNACIHVRRCLHKHIDSSDSNNSVNSWNVFRFNDSPKVCVSKWKHNNTQYNCKWVFVVNVLFSVLAITHLAYLGSTFDGKEESSTMSNVMAIWKELKRAAVGTRFRALRV